MRDFQITKEIPAGDWEANLGFVIGELEKIGTRKADLAALASRDAGAADGLLARYDSYTRKRFSDMVSPKKSPMTYEELIGALIYVAKGGRRAGAGL